MSKFIYFTPEEKARAQNTDLVSLLRAQGERPVRSGREFRPPQRSQHHRAGQQMVRPLRARRRICRQLRPALLPSPLSGGGFAFAGQKERKIV